MNHTSILNTHFGLLKEHATLVNKGLDSAQASNIVFSNENDWQAVQEANMVSDCCQAEAKAEGVSVFCTQCGEYCRAI